jgi:dihydroorotate dehydrogenase
MSVYARLRPWIYRLNPEQAHAVTLALLRLAGALPPARALLRSWFQPRLASPGKPVRAFGLDFPNPVGLAAGYDKDGLAWRGLACLGFGHLELGTVTPRPQTGNPRPRVFRLVEDEAVINRMGFPGRGSGFMVQRLKGTRPPEIVLGINIGKNKDTPLEQAAADYLALFATFAPLASYLAVNVSSPNTPGLRSLQTRRALEGLLGPLAAAREEHARRAGRRVPLLVKLAPDLDEAGLDGALEAVLACSMDGVIQGNTTLQRPGLRSSLAGQEGGLSGRPLETLAVAALRRTIARLEGRLPVVASGGVMDAAGAHLRLEAGAMLVQVYTGLIYRGPGLVREILDVGVGGHLAGLQTDQ